MKLLKNVKIAPVGILLLLLLALYSFFHFREHPEDLAREIRKTLFFAVAIILVLLVQGIRINDWMFKNRHLISAGILTTVILAIFTGIYFKAKEENIWNFLLVGLGFSSIFILMALNNIRKEKKLIRSTPYPADESGSFTSPASLFSTDGDRVLEGRILLLSSSLVLLVAGGPVREIPLDQISSIKLTTKWLVAKRILVKVKNNEQFFLVMPFPKYWQHKINPRVPA